MKQTSQKMFVNLGYTKTTDNDIIQVYTNKDKELQIEVYKKGEASGLYWFGEPKNFTFDEILAVSQLIRELREGNNNEQ